MTTTYACEKHKRLVDNGPHNCEKCLQDHIHIAFGAISYLLDTLTYGIESPDGGEESVGHWKERCTKWLDETREMGIVR